MAHRAELDANWDRIEAGEPLERIAPLDLDWSEEGPWSFYRASPELNTGGSIGST